MTKTTTKRFAAASPRLSDLKGAVTVAYVHQHDCTMSWHHSIIELLAYDMAHENRVMRGGWIAIRSGTGGLVESRNMAIKAFLGERGTEWLWWVDTDMGFEPDVIDRLYEAADASERPVVGALCFSMQELESDGMGGWKTRAVPTIYDWTKFEKQHGFAVRADFAPNTLIRCAGTGSACILLHRSVFERLEKEYGAVWYDRVPNTDTGQLISEDLSFCLRAGALNVPIHVHTGVEASHKKAVWLTSADYWKQRATESMLERQAELAASR